jgi:hypothetical protein
MCIELGQLDLPLDIYRYAPKKGKSLTTFYFWGKKPPHKNYFIGTGMFFCLKHFSLERYIHFLVVG